MSQADAIADSSSRINGDGAPDRAATALLDAIFSNDRAGAQRMAKRVIDERDACRQALDKAHQLHAEIKCELAALCNPANPLATVTALQCDGGQTFALVHCDGMSSVRARVHPAIEASQLEVGAHVFLTADRGCVLGVSPEQIPWRQIGTFEELLSGGQHALLRFQTELVAVQLVDALRTTPLSQGDRIGFHAGAGIAFTRLPHADDQRWFADDDATDDFSGLCGLDQQIQQIQRAVAFTFQHPAIARKFGLQQKRGILLDGPPGNGKTRLARCTKSYLAAICPDRPCRFMSICGSQDYSMWFGKTEEHLRDRFAAARRAAQDGPVVLFFDEFDALAKARGTDVSGGASDRVLNTLLAQLDGMESSNVLTLAATNRASSLDPAVTRPGRFDLKLTIPAPNRRASHAILTTYLRKLPLDSPLEALSRPLISRIFSPQSPYSELVAVRLSDGRQIAVPGSELVSGAMLENIVRRAAEAAAVREVEAEAKAFVTFDDLALALEHDLSAAARLLCPANVKSYVQRIPQDAQPVEVRIAKLPAGQTSLAS